MYRKSLASKASDLFSKLVIAIYVHFRKKPSTIIFQISSPGEHRKDYLQLGGKPIWKVVMMMDKAIDSLIATYGVTSYQTISLYDIDSVYELNEIYQLIVLGIVQPGDYTSDKPMSKCVRFKSEILCSHPKYKEIDNALEWKDLARKNTKNQDEYWYLHSSIVNYKYEQYKTQKATTRIEECVSLYKIETYLGKNLYQIEELPDLFEALGAVGLIHRLKKHWFVLSYEKTPLEALNKFSLESCQRDIEKGDTKAIVFDEEKKKESDEQERLEEEAEQLKRNQRNEAARYRRAQQKAAKQTEETLSYIKKRSKEIDDSKKKLITIIYSKKAHGEKIRKQIEEHAKKAAVKKTAQAKSQLKVIKEATKPKPARSATPAKKAQAVKGNNRKTS